MDRGRSLSVAFYDFLLPRVAPEERIDQIFSLGYALGYLCGGILFYFMDESKGEAELAKRNKGEGRQWLRI